MKMVLFIGDDTIDLARFDQASFLLAPDGVSTVMFVTEFRDSGPLDHAVAVLDSPMAGLPTAGRDLQDALAAGQQTLRLIGRKADQEAMESIGYHDRTGATVKQRKIVARMKLGDSSWEDLQSLQGQRIERVERAGPTVAIITASE